MKAKTWFLAGMATAVTACGPVADDEERLRALVAETEAAAEARDTGFFRDLISDNYTDRAGRGRDQIIDTIRGYFFINANVEVLNQVAEVQLIGDDVAEVVLRTALVGRAQGSSVLGIDADYYRLELELVREGPDWQIIGADWGRADEGMLRGTQ